MEYEKNEERKRKMDRKSALEDMIANSGVVVEDG